jgi:DNA-binding transcriptional regulator WhiA
MSRKTGTLNYEGLNKNQVLKIYNKAVKLRRENGFGQHRITQLINKKFSCKISEATVSGWIYKDNTPFSQESTQFKPKKVPSKKKLKKFYLSSKLSFRELGKKFGVTDNTAKKWLKDYQIKLRGHTEAMNTPAVKSQLRSKKLTQPTTNFKRMNIEKAYLLGVLCGDGHINDQFIRFEIRKDVKFIEKFVSCLNSTYGLNYTHYYYKPRNSLICYANSEIICTDLLSYGNFKTKSWRVPKAILKTKNNTHKTAFLEGYFDSDGHVGDYKVEASSINLNALTQVKKLLYQVGINSKIYSLEKSHLLVVSRKENIRKFKMVVAFSIPRKQQRLDLMYGGWRR